MDFRGGWKHRADVDPGDPHTGVRLRLVGFRMSAQLLDGEGEGGTITFEQADIDVDAASLLKQTQQFPPRYQCRLVMDPCTMTIDQPGSEPLVLMSKGKFVLVAQLTQYPPPRGDLFQLENPVDFIEVDKPDVVVGQLQKFPVKVGGL
ncbi:hypothetical protein [Streptomyces sp. 1222.5]|uniref:hypothetical protein n=1 Tax=Streptomyces sp. 1222.5 TaxID=1881026 RepID=UPI003D743117